MFIAILVKIKVLECDHSEPQLSGVFDDLKSQVKTSQLKQAYLIGAELPFTTGTLDHWWLKLGDTKLTEVALSTGALDLDVVSVSLGESKKYGTAFDGRLFGLNEC